jgi:ClpP class serine protease
VAELQRRMREQFPRTGSLPTQSSKYWAKEKDRYLRQLLITDIEVLTGREAIVYFAQLNEGINHTDPDDLSEILEGVKSKSVDLIIQTPGGSVDAIEKFVSVLRHRVEDYRVIVPSWAKSGGTVIAMSATTILLGVNSELGPIDPHMIVPELGQMPCEFVANDPAKDQVLRDYAAGNVKRMRGLAEKILRNGMLKELKEEELQATLDKLSSATQYNSHGAVIDYSEAKDLGLNVEWMGPDSELWRAVWLLYCLYDHDTKSDGLGRIVEGAINSIARPCQLD